MGQDCDGGKGVGGGELTDWRVSDLRVGHVI